MFRLCHFSTDLREVHGFKPLQSCNPGDYADAFVLPNGQPAPYGSTSLYDSSVDVIESMRVYGNQLAQQHYTANGILVVMTDGCDYPGSTHTPNDCRQGMERLTGSETLSDCLTILVGVNLGKDGKRTQEQEHVKQELERFQKEAGFKQFIALEDASEATLLKLYGWISQSVSSTSQSLAKRQVSQPIQYKI